MQISRLLVLASRKWFGRVSIPQLQLLNVASIPASPLTFSIESGLESRLYLVLVKKRGGAGCSYSSSSTWLTAVGRTPCTSQFKPSRPGPGASDWNSKNHAQNKKWIYKLIWSKNVAFIWLMIVRLIPLQINFVIGLASLDLLHT